ncbi:hypothetical protein HID58_091658 [Brassica napus]|uniref:SBP-type domain-containing protein n=1 Tax=Brassica napus TaxID=3708 RepID=A0ABQ7WYZ7_BRANA|nr:hypothetical protein HID58_091658 [Brassica napus]
MVCVFMNGHAKKKLRGIEEHRKKMRGEVRRRKINLTSTTDQVHRVKKQCCFGAMELLLADGVPFQKSYFKCSRCKSTLQATQLRYVLKQRDRNLQWRRQIFVSLN